MRPAVPPPIWLMIRKMCESSSEVKYSSQMMLQIVRRSQPAPKASSEDSCENSPCVLPLTENTRATAVKTEI